MEVKLFGPHKLKLQLKKAGKKSKNTGKYKMDNLMNLLLLLEPNLLKCKWLLLMHSLLLMSMLRMLLKISGNKKLKILPPLNGFHNSDTTGNKMKEAQVNILLIKE
jgi:hypothetical protein